MWNNTINHCDLSSRVGILDPASREYTLFLSAHETFTKINHKLNQEVSLDSFKKIKIKIFYLIIIALNEKSIPER